MLTPLSSEDLTNHAASLATTLIEENKDYTSASQIYSEHLHDIPTAARLLCRSSRFSDASRLLTLHNSTPLIPEIIDTSLGDAMGSMTDLLADFRSQLAAQVPRIGELRIRRIQDPLAYFGGDPAAADGIGGIDIPDNVSLAPTDASATRARQPPAKPLARGRAPATGAKKNAKGRVERRGLCTKRSTSSTVCGV
jgi:elongator complex protein 1